MSKPSLLDHLRYALGRLGVAGVLGLTLFVFGAVLHFAGTLNREAQIADTEAAISKAQSRLARAPEPQATPQVQLARFAAAFPRATALGELMTTMNKAAEQHALQIRNAEYRDQLDAASGLKRYQITVPFKAPYPAIRGWLVDTLNAFPSLALDDVQIKRDSIAATDVEARVRLTLYAAAD